MNIFIDNNDLEEQYGEQKYKEYLEKENKQMKQDITTMNKEIERLNNIINDLEKQLLEWHSYWKDEDTYSYEYKTAYDYLQELKEGVDKE